MDAARVDEVQSALNEIEVSTMPAVIPRPSLTLERLTGTLVGIALGDSLGLAVETMTHQQIAENWGRITDFLELDMNPFLVGKGLPRASCSDDAQLTGAMFRAYIEGNGFSLEKIMKEHILEFDRSKVGWGGSTVAGVKALKDGLTPDMPEFKLRLKSGTGNGIPMKIAAVAAWQALYPREENQLVAEVQKISSLTHPTSISVSAGLAHSFGLLYCFSKTPDTFKVEEFVHEVVRGSELGKEIYPETKGADDLTERLRSLVPVASGGPSTIIDTYGGGDCYVYNSLPFAYAFFLRDWGTVDALYEVISAGGDTDSNGALVGGLLGALHGPEIFPSELTCQVRGLRELVDLAPQFMEVSMSIRS